MIQQISIKLNTNAACIFCWYRYFQYLSNFHRTSLLQWLSWRSLIRSSEICTRECCCYNWQPHTAALQFLLHSSGDLNCPSGLPALSGSPSSCSTVLIIYSRLNSRGFAAVPLLLLSFAGPEKTNEIKWYVFIDIVRYFNENIITKVGFSLRR